MEGRRVGALITILGLSALWQQASAEGCFWNPRCQYLWLGGCGNGYASVETSNDCQGHCPTSQFGTCPPFFTRFQCCREDKARESTSCSRCPIKEEIGNEWFCCSDCSKPFITDEKSKTGYCPQTDAYLSVQPKPRELFKWNARGWTSCRGHCKKASRTREVQCLRYMENAPHLTAVMTDDKCLASTRPSSREKCTPPSCMGANHHKRQGLPVWATVLIILTSLAAVGALAFVGFIFYRRHYDSNHGFVYVMLDSYS